MENQKKTKEFIKTGKRVVEREARALDLLEKSIEESFSKAVKLENKTFLEEVPNNYFFRLKKKA